MGKVALIWIVVLVAVGQRAFAIHAGDNDLPYAQPMTHPLDKPLNDKYDGKCFFMNLGPTGIRARIDPEAPRQFKVMYVFQDDKSPARGKIEIGDMIIGANGREFQLAHGFHRKQPGARGWQGPPFELAQAIEDSQGKDGRLDLIVLPGGDAQAKKVVSIQIKPVGRFSKTYPWNCPRSEKLRKDLCDFLIKNGINGRHHYQIQQLLALWAAGDERAMPMIRAKAHQIMSGRYDPEDSGMVTWNWGYSGIFLGEYYNMTQDKAVLPAVRALGECYRLGMDWRAGAYSHRPFPFIQKRIASGGPKGYGAMAGPGGLSMLAQSTFKANGLPYPQEAYHRIHQAYLRTAGGSASASIAYGFSAWTHACIEVDNPTKGVSGQGVGYRCPTGMKDIGSYKITWPTRADPRWKPTDWVADEADTNLVFQMGDNWRLVVRQMPLPEPSRPYHTQADGGGHCAPMGMGAAAHFVGNRGNKSWNWLGEHMADGCARSPGMLFDGHADATMHGFFSVIGAAWADKQYLRSYLDYVKTLIILSEPHDGQGLVEQPFGCQRNSTCSIARDRTAYTHVVILLLSLPQKRLLITGGDPTIGDGDSVNNPMGAIQSEGFIIKHCLRQAEQLRAGHQPYSASLRFLDIYAKADNERATEAAIFAERLRAWIASRTDELIKASDEDPVAAMSSMATFARRVRGLDEEAKLNARINQINQMPGVRQLTAAYRSVQRIKSILSRTKNPRSVQRLMSRAADDINAILQIEGLDDAVRAETQALNKTLESLGASPD